MPTNLQRWLPSDETSNASRWREQSDGTWSTASCSTASAQSFSLESPPPA
jgi:hypothetical protein